jgi:hypothetical protein
MSKFATGKHALAISDRSGLQFPYREMVKEWTGALVHYTEFEIKQPQLNPIRIAPDPQALQNARPARVETAAARLLTGDPFYSSSAGTDVIYVIEFNHGRSSGDTVRFRNCETGQGFTEATLENSSGYIITVPGGNEDEYYFTASAGTSQEANKRFGGMLCTSGPVTIEG